MVILILVSKKEIPVVSTKKWTNLLAIIGLLFNGAFFILDVLNKKKFETSSGKGKYPPTFIPLYLQLTFSRLWVFFLITNTIDLIIRGIIRGSGFLGCMSILTFINMFLYFINVRLKKNSLLEEERKWVEEPEIWWKDIEDRHYEIVFY